jgi:hypothetical protein
MDARFRGGERAIEAAAEATAAAQVRNARSFRCRFVFCWFRLKL